MCGLVRFRVRDSRLSAILPGRAGSRGVLFWWAEKGFGALGALFAFEKGSGEVALAGVGEDSYYCLAEAELAG